MSMTACGNGAVPTPAEVAPRVSGGTQNPQVTIEMENGGKIVLELYPEKAPNTVNSFIKLVGDGYYDGLIFHRVISNFMIQGGDPTGTGMGGPGYSIAGEMSNNGFTQNDISHTRGILSMARSRSYDSAGSQFFIVVEDSTFLDKEYAAFGAVIEGMDVVDGIKDTKVDGDDRPKKEQKMKAVTVDTFGVTYPDPEKAS